MLASKCSIKHYCTFDVLHIFSFRLVNSQSWKRQTLHKDAERKSKVLLQLWINPMPCTMHRKYKWLTYLKISAIIFVSCVLLMQRFNIPGHRCQDAVSSTRKSWILKVVACFDCTVNRVWCSGVSRRLLKSSKVQCPTKDFKHLQSCACLPFH